MRIELLDVVAHALLYDERLGPFNYFYRTLTYITHTGSHWAAPIGHAQIEWCDKLARAYIHKGHDWTRHSEENLELCDHHSVEISPTSYEKDQESGCIRWEFHDWTPQREIDDILIADKGSTAGFCGFPLYPEPEPGPRDIWYAWCDSHLGDHLELKTTPIDDAFLERALRQSIETVEAHPDFIEVEHVFPTDDAYQAYLDRFPPHIHSLARLRLYRYLRNYYFALRDHDFQDQTLARCFQNLLADPDAGSSDLARTNIAFLLERERALQQELQEQQAAYLASWSAIHPPSSTIAETAPQPAATDPQEQVESDSQDTPTDTAENKGTPDEPTQEASPDLPDSTGCSRCATTGSSPAPLWLWLLPALLL